jgi:tRNA pseudouridine55 synthase
MAKSKRGNPINGWVIIDKPLDVTSTQVVGRVRRVFEARKAGHGGTLDPLATGILPIALGEATKTVPYLQDTKKGYRFKIAWGRETDSCDVDGRVVATSHKRPTKSEVLKKLLSFVGSIDQVPPIFSAIKVDGERAYDLARRGETVELKARKVEIFSIELLSWPGNEANEAEAGDPEFEMTCGSGTYVRSLARDLSRELGTCGHVSALRRTFVGNLGLDRAISLEKLEAFSHSAPAFEHLLPVETALDDIPALAVTAEETARIRRGQELVVVGRALSEGCDPQVLTIRSAFDPVLAKVGRGSQTEPVALGRIIGGRFRPSRVFNLG